MNRVVAVAAASMEAVKAAHASVIHEMNERRGRTGFAAAGGRGGAGFGGAGFGGAGAEGAVESSLLIGVSRE